jgi:hypothetical protein
MQSFSSRFKSFASENSAWRKYPSKIGEREDTKQRNIATLFLHSAWFLWSPGSET